MDNKKSLTTGKLATRKVFHFESPREHYRSDAAILCCFDHRFSLGFDKFLKRLGVTQSDRIKVAGGAKTLASPEHESDREFVLEQIRKSIQLHGTDRVILMVHSDCGAYGGLEETYGGNAAAESAHHHKELQRAAQALKKAIANLSVEAYFVDFEGVWEVPQESPGKAAR